MTERRAGWVAAIALSSLWLLPALLAWHLGVKADAQEHFVPGDQVNSFPYRHAQHKVEIVTLWCLGITLLIWAAVGVHALWRRRSRADAAVKPHGTGVLDD
jgi:hypothetical protein